MLRSYNKRVLAKSPRLSGRPLCFDFALTINPKITIISNSAPCGYMICRALVQFYIRVWRSLVSRLVRVQEAVGSNPATRTKNPQSIVWQWIADFYRLYLFLSTEEYAPQPDNKCSIFHRYISHFAQSFTGSQTDNPGRARSGYTAAWMGFPRSLHGCG